MKNLRVVEMPVEHIRVDLANGDTFNIPRWCDKREPTDTDESYMAREYALVKYVGLDYA